MTFEEIRKLESGAILLDGAENEVEYVAFHKSKLIIAYQGSYQDWQEHEIKDWKLKEPEPELLWRWLCLRDDGTWKFEQDPLSEEVANRELQMFVKFVKHGKPIDAKTGMEVEV